MVRLASGMEMKEHQVSQQNYYFQFKISFYGLNVLELLS